MYCPNCGNKNSEGQHFCRSCGLGLAKIAQCLRDQLPTKADKTLAKRKERLERLGVVSVSIFGVGILGFFLYNLFYKLMLTQGILVAALALLAAIIFMGCGLASVILFAKAKELKEPAKGRRDAPFEEVTSNLLESHERPAFSVADARTKLLSLNK